MCLMSAINVHVYGVGGAVDRRRSTTDIYAESAVLPTWAPTTPATCCRLPSPSRDRSPYRRCSNETRSVTSPAHVPTSRRRRPALFPPRLLCSTKVSSLSPVIWNVTRLHTLRPSVYIQLTTEIILLQFPRLLNPVANCRGPDFLMRKIDFPKNQCDITTSKETESEEE